MSNNKNPFADIFAAFSGSNPFAESADWEKVVAAGRLNAKALSDAFKAVSEGAQAVSRRQAEIAQKSAEEVSKFVKEISTCAKNPEESLAKQADFTKSAIEAALSNSKELLEMAAKSNGEANDIISKRVTAVLSELASNAANANAGASSSKKKKEEAAA